MTYAPTVAYLESLALEAGAASFWHGKQNTQSINYSAPFPQAHLFLLPAPLIGPHVAYQVKMCFYGKDEHEAGQNSAESLAIQDAMDVLSQQFVQALRESDEFELSERVDRVPVQREGSQIGTGFFLAFELKGAALC